MAEQTTPLTITEQIDADEGLKSKRKLLTITSLILLALSFSGAKVEEANTFIFKLSFNNNKGISLLLMLAVIFLLIRYYNYAYKYHHQLYKLWSDRLLKHPFFFHSHPNEPEYYGLVNDLEPKALNIEALQYHGGDWSVGYKCRPVFVRKIIYWWSDQYDNHELEVWVGWKNYFKVLRLEARYQFEGFIKHRENLDIVAPYFLGVFAIASYTFNDQVQYILKLLVGN
jgi:hypothetical protein